MGQSFKLTSRFSLSHIIGQAVSGFAMTKAVLHEVSSRERDSSIVHRVSQGVARFTED